MKRGLGRTVEVCARRGERGGLRRGEGMTREGVSCGRGLGGGSKRGEGRTLVGWSGGGGLRGGLKRGEGRTWWVGGWVDGKKNRVKKTMWTGVGESEGV